MWPVAVKAQEDAELLKSVVSPLEDEINSLKAQLEEARGGTALTASVSSVVLGLMNDDLLEPEG